MVQCVTLASGWENSLMRSIQKRLRDLGTVSILLIMAACAVNPATGRRQLMLVSESREIEMGREADGQITESFGLYASEELQAEITRIGEELASRSERPQLPWSFRVLDDPMVNAFALPGGYLFVTRGILAALNSEAELAGVLGHEIGHVTARHSVSQMSGQQLQQIGLEVGSVLSSEVASAAGVLSVGLELLNLRYSRGDESESDELGVRYMSRAGYNPNALIGVFQTLALTAGGGGRVPEWQASHPNPENREEKIREIIALSGQDYSASVERSEEYLQKLDGLMFGVDPRQGFFEGQTFHQPDMAFALDFPAGWTVVNQKTQVGAVAPDETAIVLLTLAAEEVDPERALAAFSRQEGINGSDSRLVSLDGKDAWEASFSADTEEGGLRGAVLFVEHNGLIIRLLGYSPASQWRSHQSRVLGSMRSFRNERDPDVLAVEAARIEIERLPSTMTLREFTEAYPSSVSVGQIEVLNRRSLDESIPGGTLLKRITGGRLP